MKKSLFSTSISFLRSWAHMVYWYIVYYDHYLRKESDILVKVLFVFHKDV